MRLACAPALLLVVAAAVCGGEAEKPAFQIDCAYPGGNILVDRIEGDHVYLRQDLRDTQGPWFYWNFRIRGAAGKTLTFHFMQGPLLTRMGPCCSLDGGRSWQWLGQKAVLAADPQQAVATGQAAPAKPPGPIFVYAFPADAADVRLALSIPYQESDLKTFLARHAGNPALKAAVLCRTAKGREAEVLYLGRMDEQPDYRLAFTCRHHACESVASYVLEGIMESVLADDDLGKWYRARAAVVAVPFVDKDGVEDGDQGKNRKPHDHNRDYGEDTIYPSVAAIKKLLPEWSRGRIDVAIDLHCPYLTDDYIGFIGGPEPENWQRTLRLARILEEGQKGPLGYSMKDNVPYGQTWNTSTGPQMSFGRWARSLPGISVATTIEVAYSQNHKVTMTPDAARALGRDIAVALRKYLETKENP
ncbi:MAG: hypothetical protein NT049_18685 [Planctomycetota bacterium]|nr:hypothetical protein [Planctomycetota bacterium]